MNALVSERIAGLTSGFGVDSSLCEKFERPSSDIVHLVLDLDHTLISSFEFGESKRINSRLVGNTISAILPNEYKDEFGLPEMYHAVISGVAVLIKLRPFVRRFIRTAASNGYHLHVYTKGRRSYMHEVIKLLDPTGDLIKGRQISRDDEPLHFRDNQKDIDLIFDGYYKKYIVLDDSPHVWMSPTIQPRAVVAARKYTFSDDFVTFFRNDIQTSPANYPKDPDSYLSTILVTFADIVTKVYTTVDLKIDISPLSRSSTTIDDSSEMEVQLTSLDIYDS